MSIAKINKKPLVIIAVIGIAVVVAMNFLFGHAEWLRDLFSGSSTVGEVSAGNGQSFAARNELAARISMTIFVAITALQVLAFGIGYAVVNAIRQSDEAPTLKLVRLEGSEIFFDVPLYVGLFGTISAFLVMSYSPQSSRLIAYSSTLIGIIFSLVLRISLHYPLRQKLESEKAGINK
ncbi:MAG: hypothetical protein MJ033_02245 [Victivallaceae bacterium]|nr:hypothetical protein [Victivallaceae bacterium]